MSSRVCVWMVVMVGWVHAVAHADHHDPTALARMLADRRPPAEDTRLLRIQELMAELADNPRAAVATSELSRARMALKTARATLGHDAADSAGVRAAERAWAYLALAGRKIAVAHAAAAYQGAERAAANAKEQAQLAARPTQLHAPQDAITGATAANDSCAQGPAPSASVHNSGELAPDVYARAKRAGAAAREAPAGPLRDHFLRLQEIWLQATTMEAKRILLDRGRVAAQRHRFACMERQAAAAQAQRTQQAAAQRQDRAEAAVQRVMDACGSWYRYRTTRGRSRALAQSEVMQALPVLLDEAQMWLAVAESLGTATSTVRMAQKALEQAQAAHAKLAVQVKGRAAAKRAFLSALKALGQAEHILESAQEAPGNFRAAALQPCLSAARSLSRSSRDGERSTAESNARCVDSECARIACSFDVAHARVPNCCLRQPASE